MCRNHPKALIISAKKKCRPAGQWPNTHLDASNHNFLFAGYRLGNPSRQRSTGGGFPQHYVQI
jgi:hypothetical protein